MNLFVYGALKSGKTVKKLLGKNLEKTPATLSGYRKEKFNRRDRHFTAVRGKNSSIKGFLLSGLDKKDLKTLDLYEKGEDRRVNVKCVVGNKKVSAFVYVKNK